MDALNTQATPGAEVTTINSGAWRLSIPPGPAGEYRLAQLDDTTGLARSTFLWQPPARLEITARVSSQAHPGTWGFGLWNNPFSAGMAVAGGNLHLPALPNAAWFFFASPHNHLSLRDHLPGHGMLAGVFSSPHLPALLLAPGAIALPLLLSRWTAPLVRRLLRQFVREDAARLETEWEHWHRFAFTWEGNGVTFELDGAAVHHTAIVPRVPLGLVLWIDNQYASLAPKDRLRYGFLKADNESALEIRDLRLVRSE